MNRKVVNAENGKTGMEVGDHFKNGTISKSKTSRENFLRNFFFELWMVAVILICSSTGCERVKVEALCDLSDEKKLEIQKSINEYTVYLFNNEEEHKKILKLRDSIWAAQYGGKDLSCYEQNVALKFTYIQAFENKIARKYPDYDLGLYEDTSWGKTYSSCFPGPLEKISFRINSFNCKIAKN